MRTREKETVHCSSSIFRFYKSYCYYARISDLWIRYTHGHRIVHSSRYREQCGRGPLCAKNNCEPENNINFWRHLERLTAAALYLPVFRFTNVCGAVVTHIVCTYGGQLTIPGMDGFRLARNYSYPLIR